MIQFIVFGFLTIFMFIFWKRKYYSIDNLPPGPIRWPILGSLPQMLMIDRVYPHLQLSGLAKKYGPVMSIGYGSFYAVVLTSFEAMNDLLKRPETTIDRFRFLFTEQRSFQKNLGIIFGCGNVWEEQRKYTVKHLRDFGFGKSCAMEKIIKDEIDFLVDEIRKETKVSGGVWKVNSTRLSIVVINILWSSVGGYRFDADHPITKRHIEINSNLFKIFGPKNYLSAFPFLKRFPNLSGYNKQTEWLKDNQDFIKELINDAKEKMEGRVEPQNFVETYLKQIEMDKNNPNSQFTEEQLIVIIMDLFFAGGDTTSTVFSWTLLFFALYPDVQLKAKAEMMKQLDAGINITSLSAYSRMPYIRACILETMRLAPFGPHPPPRRVAKEILYGKYRIPKGTMLMYSLYTIFHDEVYWGNPEVFRPDRFLDSSGADLDLEKVERVAQFGFGKRICPGENMAMNTLFLFCVTVLKEFSFEIVPGNEPSIEPSIPALTLSPHPYSVLVKKESFGHQTPATLIDE